MTNIDLCPFTKMNDKTRKALKAFNHPMVDEIENLSMDDNRFFAHLKEGFFWDSSCDRQTQSFSTVTELQKALKYVAKL